MRFDLAAQAALALITPHTETITMRKWTPPPGRGARQPQIHTPIYHHPRTDEMVEFNLHHVCYIEKAVSYLVRASQKADTPFIDKDDYWLFFNIRGWCEGRNKKGKRVRGWGTKTLNEDEMDPKMLANFKKIFKRWYQPGTHLALIAKVRISTKYRQHLIGVNLYE